jgi:antirestriction protein
MHEYEPTTGDQESEQPPGQGPWDPDEQVGDVYAVDANDQGDIERAERLQPQPSIWVGSWLDYNNGILYGQWIDAARDDDEIWTDISAMLASSPAAARTGETAEDWGIFDYDNFGPLRLGEQEDVAWIGKVARGIAEHGLAYAAYADLIEDADALDGFTDAYLGHYDSARAYVEQLIDDLGYEQLLDEAIPGHLRSYVRVDVDQLAHDMEISGDIHIMSADDGGFWLFDMR